MDSKKVANLIPKDENGLPFLFADDGVTPLKFHAEFNDAVFDGNVSALSGTFSGKLTAQAIDAVGNITIKGEAIAKTVVTERAKFQMVARDEIKSVIDTQIVVDEGEDGILIYSLQFSADTAGIPYYKQIDGVIDWYDDCELYVYVDDKMYFQFKHFNEEGVRIGWRDYSINSPNFSEIFIPVSAGLHVVSFQIEQGFAKGVPNMPGALIARNIIAKCDYIRKL